ncbi:MAG: ABC transporter ATP-binding protein [Candidatus Bathyarchaeia archaeon]
MTYAVESRGLTKVYRSEGERVMAVDNLTMTVDKGSVFGLLGPNGAGKTTFISMLVGLTLPTSGSASVLGHDIVRESIAIRKVVGLLPEGFGFYDHLTARQNLMYIAMLNDIPKGKMEECVTKVLEKVELKEVADRKVGVFSRGMKQRLAVAQALIKDPELLIFDEPTAGLDPEGAWTFRETVLTLNKEEGKTVILSTHLLFEVGPLCDSIAVINKGRLVVQGRVKELIERMMVEQGYRIVVKGMGDLDAFCKPLRALEGVKDVKLQDGKITVEASSDVRASISRLAPSYGVELLVLDMLEPSLEDLFMNYYKREGISYG